MLVAVALDIPIARQIIGVAYVSFIPGILIVGILKLNLKSVVNTFLFSVGLSIAFLMFVGVAVNVLCPLMGVSNPLATLPLLIAIGLILLAMTFIFYKRDDQKWSFSLPRIKVLHVLLLSTVPFLAIVGAAFANTLILLLMVIIIIVVVIIAVFSKKLISNKVYSIVIVAIALSLLFHSQFISKYLQGWDVLSEFYVFRLTQISSLWNPSAITSTIQIDPGLVNYNSMLSVTILPTIYSNLLNIQGELIFKFGYLLIYALVPLTVYQVYKRGFGRSIAFLSALYFVIFPRFFTEERRQIVGELFLVLLIFLILDKSIDSRKRKILLYVFGAALVVSHYSLSYIFMFFILSVLIITFIAKRFSPGKWNPEKKQVIDAGFVLFIFVLNFLWYVFVTPFVSQTFFSFFGNIANSFITGFSSVGSRGGTVSDFVTPNIGNMNLTYKVDYVINKTPYFLIIVGFIALLKNYRKLKINFEYLPLVLANTSILLMVLAVPSFAPAFLAERYFHVSLLVLSPVCIYGGIMLLKWIMKPFMNTKRVRSLGLRAMCILLIVVFLFKVGFVYEVTGDVANSVYIGFTNKKNSDSPRIEMELYEWYIPEQDVYSAIWLSHMTENGSKIYADETASIHVLRAYGMKIIGWKSFLSNETTIQANAYVYLRYLNVKGWLKENEGFSNITDISHQLNLTNQIYSNGGSEIYYAPAGG
jgi:uncharacterized membrane protein